MADSRQKNGQWRIEVDSNGRVSWDQIKVAVLMDIRDELQTLNRLLACPNFTGIPRTLKRISSNTANLPKVRRKAAG